MPAGKRLLAGPHKVAVERFHLAQIISDVRDYNAGIIQASQAAAGDQASIFFCCMVAFRLLQEPNRSEY